MCIKCMKEFNAMIFGFGEIICPDCFNAEEEFIFIDMRYWLNRIVARELLRNTMHSRIIDPEATLYNAPTPQEITH